MIACAEISIRRAESSTHPPRHRRVVLIYAQTFAVFVSVAAFDIPAESDERRFLGSASAPAGGGVVDSYATALSFEPRDEATERRGARFWRCSTCMPTGTATAVAIGSVDDTVDAGRGIERHLRTQQGTLRARESGAA